MIIDIFSKEFEKKLKSVVVCWIIKKFGNAT